MLENYYASLRTIDNIRSLWLAPGIERYAEWMSEREFAQSTAKSSIQVLVQFNKFVLENGVTDWKELPELLNPFVDKWTKARSGWCRTSKDRSAVHARGRLAVEQMLRLMVPNFKESSKKIPLPFIESAPLFFEYLLVERGLRPSTVKGYICYLRGFEAYLNNNVVVDLSKLKPLHIHAYVVQKAEKIQACSVIELAGVMRVFLQYLYRQDITDTNLSRAVPKGRGYRQSSIPRSITWCEVQKVLDDVDRRSSVGKRDYAILLLLVNYGLRAREVAALQLDDINWKKAQLIISARKGGHSTIYPLSVTVGDALVDYIRNARRVSDHRSVFLGVRSPFAPMNHLSVSKVASRHLIASGVNVRRPGSHTFRHTCVQRLVDADVPFKTIGDYVGHKTPSATQIYGKVALCKLREIAAQSEEDIL